jgi:hypothetical protein
LWWRARSSPGLPWDVCPSHRELHTGKDAAKNAASFISPVAWPLQIVLLVTQILLSKDAPAPKWMKVEDRRTAVAEP